MKIFKIITIFTVTSLIPVLGIVLITNSYIRIILLGLFLFFWAMIFLFAEKIILMALGAREIIDSDNQPLFQSLKGQTYRYQEKMPRIFLYPGHRVKCYVLQRLGGWSIVLDRKLIKELNKEQIEALVTYTIEYKKKGQVSIQTVGMGVMSFVMRSTYWFWSQLKLSPKSKIYKVGIFITLIMIKPIVEFVLAISKTRKKIDSSFALKSIYLQVDQDVINRSFTEFMIYHLDSEDSFTDLMVELLEEYPMLENCNFKETV